MPLTLETAPADTPLIAHLVTGATLHPDVVGRLAKGIFARPADQLARSPTRTRPRTCSGRVRSSCATTSRITAWTPSPTSATCPARDGVTVLRVPFENDDAFDRRVDDLLVAIALTAEPHRCASESDAWADIAGEGWRW
ncbi:hypothetical protein [Burkholderia anthinoferrum]|uniref:hypothetical protein n=1 Tax=Burkholderia anthinoferrum TaxID=3090833 RepID=UPI0021562AF4|nr:hypothetical protein [Burkholderia anthinoferrum]